MQRTLARLANCRTLRLRSFHGCKREEGFSQARRPLVLFLIEQHALGPFDGVALDQL